MEVTMATIRRVFTLRLPDEVFDQIGRLANLQIGVKPQNEKFTLDALVLKTGMANRPAKELVLQI